MLLSEPERKPKFHFAWYGDDFKGARFGVNSIFPHLDIKRKKPLPTEGINEGFLIRVKNIPISTSYLVF